MRYKLKIIEDADPNSFVGAKRNLCACEFVNIEAAYWMIQEVFRKFQSITPFDFVQYSVTKDGSCQIHIYIQIADNYKMEKVIISLYSFGKIELDKKSGIYDFPAIPNLPQYCIDLIDNKKYSLN